MSSIRPLATITLLALVGVFLYMKINETEPQLPADIADWNIPTELDITQSPATPSFESASSVPAAPATSSAPAFAPAAPPTSSAPAFSSSPPAFQPETKTTDESLTQEPDLPPMPAVPTLGKTDEPVTPEPSSPTEDISSVKVDPPVAQQSPSPPAAQPQASLFSATRLTVQSALDRGELSQALLLLSDWYGDPSLSPAETKEVDLLLSQLAGSVIYSTEHRLEPPYMVQDGEGLEEIAKKFEVPWQLLAKINGLSGSDTIQPGQQLKVVRGPFSALVDLSQRRLTLMLDRRYAGQFAIDVDPDTSVEAGHWAVNQKLVTPGNVGLTNSAPATPSDQKSIMMTGSSGGANGIAIIRGSNSSAVGATDPVGRVLRLKSQDVEDVYDILSLGSQVIIRR